MHEAKYVNAQLMKNLRVNGPFVQKLSLRFLEDSIIIHVINKFIWNKMYQIDPFWASCTASILLNKQSVKINIFLHLLLCLF